MKRRNYPGDVQRYLALLDQTLGRRPKPKNEMRPIFISRPGETEEQARQRLAAERGDFLTPSDRAEDRNEQVLAELRKKSNNPKLK